MVYAFTREMDGDKVAVIINLSAEPQNVMLEDGDFVGDYTEVFTGEEKGLSEEMSVELEPWGYRVYSNK